MARQTISIKGSGFGSQTAYDGDSPYILISDLTRRWNAGYSKGYDLVKLSVASWTDTQITIRGFTGAYGRRWRLNPGDQVRIQVWNPQTGAGPATVDTGVSVNAAPNGPLMGQVSSQPNLVGQWRWTSGRGRFRYVMYITSQTRDGHFRGYLSGENGIISGQVKGNDVEFTRVLTRFGNKEQTYTGELTGSKPYLKIVRGRWSGAFEENGEKQDWHAEMIP